MSKICRLEQEHAPLVAEIEKICFGDAWSQNIVTQSIRQAAESEQHFFVNGETDAVSYGAFGLFEEEELAGYLFCMSVAPEGELHRIAVKPEFRGKHLSIALMNAFFEWLYKQKDEAVTLEVRAGNTPAVSLYHKYGFLEEGRRKNYYHNPDEDALILWKRAPKGELLMQQDI